MSMFCFQCEQTYQGKGCQLQGVCGKKAATANLQDQLTGKLIELANTRQPNEQLTKFIIDGLFTTVTNVNFDDSSIARLVEIAETIQDLPPLRLNGFAGVRYLSNLIPKANAFWQSIGKTSWRFFNFFSTSNFGATTCA